MTDIWVYSKQLAEQLRINGMKEERVREVVAEVQQHVLVTGQDPVEAFGQPTDYALTWMAPTPRRWAVRGVAAVVGITSLLALPRGAFAQEAFAGPVDIEASYVFLWVTWVVCIGVMPWTAEVWLARLRGRRLGRAKGIPVVGLLVVASALVMTLVWVGGSMLTDTDAPVLSAPRWVLLAIGIVGLPGLAFVGSHRNTTLPDRPGSEWTWRTRLRRVLF